MPSSLPAYKIRDESLSALRQSVIWLSSPDCVVAIKKESKAVRNKWAMLLLDTAYARNELETKSLGNIRDELKKHDTKILAATKSVKKKTENLKKLEQTLDAIAGFLELIAKTAAIAI